MGNLLDYISKTGGLPRLVVAGDVPFHKLCPIMAGLEGSEYVAAVKVGVKTQGKHIPLSALAEGIHDYGLQMIFDMQKLGRDIPDITRDQASLFASVSDAVIVDPKSVAHWRAAYAATKAQGVPLITVLYMTDEKGEASLNQRLDCLVDIVGSIRGEGGLLEAVVLPANQLDTTKFILQKFKGYAGNELQPPLVCGPGIGAQGGESEAAGAAGVDIGIVGRAITGATDKIKAAEEIYQSLKRGYDKRIASNM